ncbi:hypothetical protein OIU79_004131 [Salix purpurea]|uniref:Uncharacterized protein n=1 Tax=Salix purpurea TaxID=77065 RepID=A0A9Q0Z8Z7_SALPP|nr:hypothetical protein OIU79_004131 [Salix purpurea]
MCLSIDSHYHFVTKHQAFKVKFYCCFSSHVQPFTASRILPEDLTGDLSLQSLQRGTIPPLKGSGCTNIPGGDGESCTLVNEMHYAGHGLPPDTAFPRLAVPFGVATSQS